MLMGNVDSWALPEPYFIHRKHPEGLARSEESSIRAAFQRATATFDLVVLSAAILCMFS